MIKILRYTPDHKHDWDTFASNARNNTLLHQRNYMDYHSDRFKDASLMFYDEHERLIALFPACISNNARNTIISHQGLTYGGFIISPMLHTFMLEEIFNITIGYYRTKLAADTLIVKPIPQIYASVPCEEELYLIHRHGGILIERHLSQAIRLDSCLPLSNLRKRCVNKALKNNIIIKEATERNEWDAYHSILKSVLTERHSTTPVHSPAELWSLHCAFPKSIRLLAAYEADQLVAGTIVYTSSNVAHTQYLASSDKGLATGALDLVVFHLLHSDILTACQYLDFGVSTERDGTLNRGLTLQKEGFGARGICYDTYSIPL